MKILFLLIPYLVGVYEGFAQANWLSEPKTASVYKNLLEKQKGELQSETSKWTSFLVPPPPPEIDNESESSEKFYNRTKAEYKIQQKERQSQSGTSEISQCSRPGLFALTFDDGPSYNGNTESVLDVLAEKGVKATFFVTGYGYDTINLTTDSRKQKLLQRAHREGHQIASHTFTHNSLVLPGNRTRESIIQDISNLANAVSNITGLHLKLLRAPYGDLNATVLDLIDKEFGYKVIQWNIDTKDWHYRNDIEKSFKVYPHIMRNARLNKNSYIALHHDPVIRSGELAAMAIDFVRSKGFKLVTVGECIGMDKESSGSV